MNIQHTQETQTVLAAIRNTNGTFVDDHQPAQYRVSKTQALIVYSEVAEDGTLMGQCVSPAYEDTYFSIGRLTARNHEVTMGRGSFGPVVVTSGKTLEDACADAQSSGFTFRKTVKPHFEVIRL